MKRVQALILSAAILACVPVFAQPSAGPASGVIAAKRPKVCLVLSGGGARGAAHIGVLKALEAMRIPIDCITGTSMGALVGAAYASGMAVDEMTRMIAELSLDRLFDERAPREERAMRRKRDDARNLFLPSFGLGDDLDLRFQKGIRSGVALETVLRRLARVKGHVDFDTLAIPFRAVATDLVTGKPVVFQEGELALVMRASMSVPGFIAPAEFDGMLLIDGGLVNNLPVDVARDLGADIVIAVNLGTPLMKREAIRDVRAIASQVLNILTEQNVQASLASLGARDILIEPDLGDFSAADFDALASTVPIGEAAAQRVAERLAALAVPPGDFVAYQARRTRVDPPDTRPIDDIAFAPMRRVNPEYAASMMNTKPGRPIDQATLDADLLRLYGTDDFEHVNYRLIESPQRRILNVEAVEKSWGPNYGALGLGLSSDFSGRAYFNLLGQYRRTWLNPLGGEWRTDVSIGRNSSIATELYQPLEPQQRLFVVPQLHAERFHLEVFDGKHPIAEYAFPTVLAGVDLGAQHPRFGEVRVGVFAGRTDARLARGTAVVPEQEATTQVGVRLRAFVDQLDNASFPKRGYAADLSVIKGIAALGSENDYDRVDATAIVARTVGRHTLHAAVRATRPLSGDQGANYTLVPWGGFLQQSGFATGQLLYERFAFGRLAYTYRLRDAPLFEGVYVGASVEIGRYSRPLLSSNQPGTLHSASAFVAVDSLLGPIYLGYGVGSRGNRSAYFFLGRP